MNLVGLAIEEENRGPAMVADRGIACGLRLAALGLESQHWANRSDCRKPQAAQQCLSQSPSGGAP